MTRWQKACLLLLRLGLWADVETDALAACAGVFPLTENEWWLLNGEAERQTVTGLVWQGFLRLPEAWHPPMGLVLRWAAVADGLERCERRMAKQTACVIRQLEAQGIEPLLLKGQALSRLYPCPAMRMQGDIDLFVGSGIRSDRSFTSDGIVVELHRRMIDIESPFKVQAVARLTEYSPVRMTLPNGFVVKTTAPVPTLLMLNAHLLKHASTVGVGLRQFCDLARAYHSWKDCYDPDELMSHCQALGLTRWTALLHTFIADYLSPPSPMTILVATRHSEAAHLMSRVLRWGNFGQHKGDADGNAQTTHSKWHTVGQMTGSLPFALRYAPAEALFRFANLGLQNIGKFLSFFHFRGAGSGERE